MCHILSCITFSTHYTYTPPLCSFSRRCKRYEKFPIAVLKEAVPYDFGGIDIIDELTVAPSKKKDSKKSQEEKPESTNQSTMSGPEEPSLRNVVTAAEDFIKVLATVSTSQSSTTDSKKGETKSSEKKKKKRKNTGKKKKTTKKPKGKGKGQWRKKKQKVEEAAAVSPSGSKAEEVIGLNNFIGESHKHEESTRNTNRVDDGEYKLLNEVMKDEPAIAQESVSITPSTVQKKVAEFTLGITSSTPTTERTARPHEGHTRRLRKERRKKSKKIALAPSAELETSTTDNLKAVSTPTVITKTPQPKPQSPVVSHASTPIIIPKVKRNRSKERGDREGRKKRRKLSSASSIVAPAHENSSVDSLKVIPLSGAPTVPTMPTTERRVSHRTDAYGGKTSVRGTAMNFRVLKRQKPKGLKSRKRKTVWPPSSENPLFHNGSENIIPILTSQEKSDPLNRSATTSAGATDSLSEWRLFTAATSIITQRHRQTLRQQRKPRKKAMAASLRDGASIPKQTEQTPITFTSMPPKVATTGELNVHINEKTRGTTSATPVMSPIQLSIERAKAQFTRKKRRKAAQSVRQR